MVPSSFGRYDILPKYMKSTQILKVLELQLCVIYLCLKIALIYLSLILDFSTRKYDYMDMDGTSVNRKKL